MYWLSSVVFIDYKNTYFSFSQGSNVATVVKSHHRRNPSQEKLKKTESLESNSSLSHKRFRRPVIPPRPNYSLNLWSIMKNCIGKELSKIPMPVSVIM